MLISRGVAVALLLNVLPTVGQADVCAVRDFLTLPLAQGKDRTPIEIALEIAYPGLRVDMDKRVVLVNGRSLPLGQVKTGSAKQLQADPSIVDQFVQLYPLDFDLAQRQTPWFDPGRARNDPFFRALYGQSEGQVARQLRRVAYRGSQTKARFAITRQFCAAAQLQAALGALMEHVDDFDAYFTQVGGSFNWRRIAGTQRMSAHSFGVAVDFNTRLGGYWRWSGRSEGNAGDYQNKYPAFLVQQMERFGFIWGGKWHHFDGMHFEYRPELILYARLKKGSQNN